MIFVLVLLVLLDSLSGGQAQTCTWNEAATTYTRAVGASVTFTLTVAGEVLTNADRITWKLGTNDLVVLRYSSTTPTFSEITSTDGVTAASQSNSHSLTISSLPISYNAQEITVISGGCTVNDVSNVITLNVQYGNLESFQPEAYATDQSNCSLNCVRTFRCYSNGDFTFTATLQADTTWDVEYATMNWFHITCIIVAPVLSVVNIIVVAIPQGPYCTPERIYGGFTMGSMSLTSSLIGIIIHAVNWSS